MGRGEWEHELLKRGTVVKVTSAFDKGEQIRLDKEAFPFAVKLAITDSLWLRWQ